MASLQDLATGRTDVLKMDPRKIKVISGFNVRIPGPELEAHIESLMLSIEAVGVQEPLTAYRDADGNPALTNGHCRHEAVMRLINKGVDIKTVPLRVEDRFANEADHVLSMITRNSGKPLGSLEMGEVLKRLHNYGWELHEIATKTGMSKGNVERLLGLTAAPVEIKKMVSDGEISATMASKAIQAHKGKAPAVLKAAVTSAKATGKTKATQQHMPATKPNWNKLGPEMRDLLSYILTTSKPHDATVTKDVLDAVREFYGEHFDHL